MNTINPLILNEKNIVIKMMCKVSLFFPRREFICETGSSTVWNFLKIQFEPKGLVTNHGEGGGGYKMGGGGQVLPLLKKEGQQTF